MKTWNVYGLTIVGVKLKDPRVFMSCVLIIYTIVGQTILTFDHGWSQILLSLFVACSVDVLLNFWKTRQIILPVSGVITGLGLGLLIEATSPTLMWPYIVAPIIAIASKSLVKVQGRHIFNPSNFGLVVLLLLFPSAVTTTVTQWTGSLVMVGIILVVGTFSSFRVSRLDLVLSFIAGFCVMALIEEQIKQSGYALVFGPLFGAGLQLFILSMITDPKTTPNTSGLRIAFGLAIALLDGLLRLANNQYSPFIALFIVSACFSLYQAIVNMNWKSQPATHGHNDEKRPDETLALMAATPGPHDEIVPRDASLSVPENDQRDESKPVEEPLILATPDHLEKIVPAQVEEPLFFDKDEEHAEGKLIEIPDQVRT